MIDYADWPISIFLNWNQFFFLKWIFNPGSESVIILPQKITTVFSGYLKGNYKVPQK